MSLSTSSAPTDAYCAYRGALASHSFDTSSTMAASIGATARPSGTLPKRF
jgi:hypothetical protein